MPGRFVPKRLHRPPRRGAPSFRRAHHPAFGAVLVIVSAILYIAGRDPAPRSPDPSPSPAPVVEIAGQVQAIGDVPDGVRTRITEELSVVLKDVYERAFLPPLPAPSPRPTEPPLPSPTPVARPPVDDLFTAEAAGELNKAPQPFDAGADEYVSFGRVRFRGIVTAEGEQGAEALLDVTFNGRGRLMRQSGPATLRLQQSGQLRLIRTAEGWRVDGFDVVLRVSREKPPSTPASSPR